MGKSLYPSQENWYIPSVRQKGTWHDLELQIFCATGFYA